MDTKKLLAAVDPGSVRTWGAAKVTLPNNLVLEDANITDDDYHARFNSFMSKSPRHRLAGFDSNNWAITLS